MAFHNSVSFLSFFVVLAILPITNAQIVASPCTAPMLTSFTPCMNFLGNGNGTAAPSAGCCNALKTMMGNGSACLCAIATGGVPFQIPINPNTTMSLPRACNMARIPLQCKGKRILASNIWWYQDLNLMCLGLGFLVFLFNVYGVYAKAIEFRTCKSLA